MAETREEIEAETKRLKAEYKHIFDSVTEILFRNDPIEINFEHNTDEYYPEARTILPRLKTCHSVEDVNTVVHEEFLRWFDFDIAGERENYRQIAVEIWDVWKHRKGELNNLDAS